MLRGFYALMILLSCSAMATAAQLTYSWSGTVTQMSPDGADPWAVGATGQPYSVSITVDQAAVDVSPGAQLAIFSVLGVNFALAGVPLSSVNFADSHLAFIDGYIQDDLDEISVSFNVELNGHTESFSTGAILPSDSFWFLLSEENPPVFAPLTTPVLSWFYLELYRSNTPAGNQVTSTLVPEPSTYALAATALAALVWSRRRRV